MSETRMLFQPIQIKSMRLKNRLGFAPFLNMPGVFTEFAITDETVRWFEQRAQGGTALIMTGGLIPMIIGVPGFKEGLGRLAEVIHSYDAKLGVQLVGTLASQQQVERRPRRGDDLSVAIVDLASCGVDRDSP